MSLTLDDLKRMSPSELKVLAYDISRTLNDYNEMLRAINNEIGAKEAFERENQAKKVVNDVPLGMDKRAVPKGRRTSETAT